jgi:hypothetical protein
MSRVADTDVLTARWLAADEMRALGFVPGGPEVDFGLRWGERKNIRVSFAPLEGSASGYLYAHDPTLDRYLLLAARTTVDQVDAAWCELLACSASPDGYLALAALDLPDEQVPSELAQQLLLHCVDGEMAAHQDFITSGVDEPVRFDAAYALVVQRSARVAAEDLQIAAVRSANPGSDPVVVRYRVLGESRWTGRIAANCLGSAAEGARQIQEVADRHGLEVQATSVTHGHSVVAAARVPDLGSIAQRAEIPGSAPRLAI